MFSNRTLAAVLQRDRAVVLASLLLLSLLAWSYLVWFSGTMEMMPSVMMMGMPGMAPYFQEWSSFHFLAMFAMWSVMMVGMMTPSVAPMVLLYAGVARSARKSGKVFAPTAWFVAGYLLVWTVFSALVTLVQWRLHAATLLSPRMVSTSPIFGGAMLIAAGIFQFTPLKHACLAHCRTPLQFLMTNWREGYAGALKMGLQHGIACTGCCWLLMVLLFVGGVMNFAWIALLMILVLLEKIVPRAIILTRASGLLMILAGGGMLFLR